MSNRIFAWAAENAPILGNPASLRYTRDRWARGMDTLFLVEPTTNRPFGLRPAGDLLSMSPELINNIGTLAGVIVAALGAFAFAFWIAIGVWCFNDIRSRTHDWLAIVLAVVLVLVFPIVGLILYWLIRPRTSLADVYDRALEEEALLRELEETSACATCGVPVKEGWVYCPNCHSQLQHTCPTCNNLVRNEWAICVFCGTPQRAPAQRPAEVSVSQSNILPPVSQPVLQSASQTSQQSAGSALRRPAARNPFGAPATSQSAAQQPAQSSAASMPSSPYAAGSMPPASGVTSTGVSSPGYSPSGMPAGGSMPPSSTNPSGASSSTVLPNPFPSAPYPSSPSLDELDDDLYRPAPPRPSEGSVG